MSCLGRVVKLFTLKLKVGQTENPQDSNSVVVVSCRRCDFDANGIFHKIPLKFGWKKQRRVNDKCLLLSGLASQWRRLAEFTACPTCHR